MRTSIIGKPNTKATTFSLIELIVVLVLIGLALAIAIPRLAHLPESIRYARAVRTFKTAFRTASNNALSSGNVVRLKLRFGDGSSSIEPVGRAAQFQLEGVPATSPISEYYAEYRSFPLPHDTKLDEAALDHQFSAEEDAVYFFYPNGEAAGPSLPVLVSTRKLQLDVDRLTGRPVIVGAR